MAYQYQGKVDELEHNNSSLVEELMIGRTKGEKNL